MKCEICQRHTESKYGVCRQSPECRDENSRRRRQASPGRQHGHQHASGGKRLAVPEPGFIYFIAPEDDPYVKIGLARKSRQGGVQGRIKSMQTGHPKLLYPMHTVESADVFRDERVIHGFFEEFHMTGGGSEWFKVPDGMSFPDWLRDNWDWDPWRDEQP
jgi:hypothetical protein